MPKVSIVMPMYNQENYIGECLESVINQTLEDIEIIIVNDGSKDKSLEIVQKYAKNDPRIIIIDKPNTGYGDSMNVGIDRATGEYIGIVETDDFVALDMYETLYNAAIKNNAEIVRADFYRFVGEGDNKELSYGTLFNNKSYYNKITSAHVDKTIFYLTMMNWTGIHKRSFLKKYNIRHNTTPGASFQDNGFFFQVFSWAKRIYFIDKPLYRVRRDNPNSSIKSKAKVYCICEEYAYIYKFLEKNPALKEKFIDIFYNKMLHNYTFTYNRVAEEYKEEFLLRFADDFHFALEMGFLKEEYLTPSSSRTLNKVFNDAKLIEEKIKQENKKIKKDCNYFLNLDPSNYENELKLWFKNRVGYKLDFDNPVTFNQKLQWMKLYDSTQLKSDLTDKYKVREWVKNKIGEEYLIPLLGVWDKFDDINFETLPDKFVLKCNHACGYNQIVLDKSKLDLKELKDKFDTWMEIDWGFRYGLELHYSNIERKIIAEEYMENNNHDLYDYKFLCFNGEPKYIWVDTQRFTKHARDFFDLDWNYLDLETQVARSNNPLPKPVNLEKMIELARILSSDFPQVRVDLYMLNNGTIKFGGLTFTCGSGDLKWSPRVVDYQLGQLFSLPKKTEFNRWRYPIPKLSVDKKENIQKSDVVVKTDKGDSVTKVDVSVILPVYNVGKYLKQCLDSIRQQTLKNIEIICIDDGSTDNSYDILKEYSLKDPRIHVLRQKNQGAGVARNRGLTVANGEYLSFLDSDDYFAPTMLEEMYKLAKINDNDIIICRAKAFNQQTGKEEPMKWTLKERFLPAKKVFSCYDLRDYAFDYAVGWAWDKLYKRTFIQIHGIKFQEIRTSNDAFFTFIANLKARKVSVVNKELAIHRIKTKTSLSQTRELSYDCFYKALIAIKNELIEYGIYYDFERAFISWALQFCIWHFNTISDESKQKQKLYKILKKKCFKELEFHKYPREWFYKKEYECYLRIKKLPFANNNKLNNLYVVTSWPFRMIRNFFRCWRDNGFKYTMTRVRVKLKFVKDKLKSMTTKGKE